jgi:hypothetical protein
VANPSLFRKLKYEESISADVLNPMSEDLERQFGLAQWDRMIQQVPTGVYDAEETGKLLLDIFPRTKKNSDKFLAKQQPGQSPMGMPPTPQGSPPKPMMPQGPGMNPAVVGAGAAGKTANVGQPVPGGGR